MLFALYRLQNSLIAQFCTLFTPYCHFDINLKLSLVFIFCFDAVCCLLTSFTRS